MADQLADVQADDARYAALAQSLEAEAPEVAPQEAEAPTEKPAPQPDKAAEAKAPEKKPYEDLERNYQNLQKALGETRGELKERRAREEALANQMNSMQEFIRNQLAPRQQQELTPDQQFKRYLEGLETTAQQANAQAQRVSEQLAEQTNMQEMQRWAVTAENEFRATKPDYMQAAEMLGSGRLRELAAFMPGRSQAELTEVLRKEQIGLMDYARQNNLNPAEVVYNMAVARGYSPQAAASAAQAAPAAAQPAPAAASPLDTIKAGMKAANSLGSGGAVDTKQFPTTEELSEMYLSDPEAASEMFAKMKKAGVFGAYE